MVLECSTRTKIPFYSKSAKGVGRIALPYQTWLGVLSRASVSTLNGTCSTFSARIVIRVPISFDTAFPVTLATHTTKVC